MLLDERRGTLVAAALERHRAQCAAGRGAACTRAGRTEARLGSKGADARAADAYARACKAADGLGCASLGIVLDAGRGIARAPKRAAAAFGAAKPLLEATCKESPSLECVALGLMFERGRGVAADPKEASSHYERACAAGILDGCTGLGVMRALTGLQDPSDETLRKSCDAGDAVACNDLGVLASGLGAVARIHAPGVPVLKFRCDGRLEAGCTAWGPQLVLPAAAPNMADARSYLERACAAKQQDACVNLGGIVRQGYGGPIDAPRARVLFEAACEAGNAAGCGEAGTLQAYGAGGRLDREKAGQTLTSACDGGEYDACVVLDEILLDDTESAPEAFADLTKICKEDRVAVGCYSLALAHILGTGTPANAAEGLALQERACDGRELTDRYTGSCENLAVLLVEGVVGDSGSLKDPNRGVLLLERECNSKQNKDACAILARMTFKGEGVSPDTAKGFAQMQSLCDEMVGLACSDAADVIMSRKPNRADDKRAFELATRACDLGDGHGCGLVGRCHRTGRGVAKKDEVAARAFFEQACVHRAAWACEELRKRP